MKHPLALLLLLLALTAGAQSLADELRREIGSDNIGVAVITSWGDTVVVNGERHYPLMSVFKFHRAVALARKLGYPGILATEVEVSPDDLREDTWSPYEAPQSLRRTRRHQRPAALFAAMER